jgi:hypothetical protein
VKKTLRQLAVREARDLLRSLDGASTERPPVTGVEFPEGMEWRFKRLEGIRVRDVDCGGPKIFGSLLRRPLIKGCSFQDVILDGLAVWRVDFVECRFEATSIGKRYRGLFKKSSFVGCSFIDCRIEGVTFDGSSLTRCHFERSHLSDVRWDGCVLKDLDGSGSMKAVGFVGCELRQVDLSAMAFSGCSFLDNNAVDLGLPDNPTNFLLAPQILLEAQDALEKQLSPMGFEQYVVLARILSRSRSDLLVDESLFQRVPEADRSVVMAALFKLHRFGA